MSNKGDLSRLVAAAHKMRAKERALRFAVQLERPIYVYRGRSGLEIDTQAPTLEPVWNVATPSGEYLTMKRKV